ncbi:MAG: tetratricopeptide repeat protein [Desulfobacteraceae bacterium]|nr:MAG: tetratricopeptide repeat protein [Desulfobacteraceae bacterium]
MKGISQLHSAGLFACVLAFFLIVPVCGCTSKENKKARHLEKARQYAEEKEFQKAVIELKNVIQLDGDDDAAYVELGEMHLKLKQGHEAYQSFLKAASLNPDNSKAQLKIGQMLLLGRKPEEARKKAELVLKSAPGDVEALGLLSGVQVQEKDIDGAMETLKKALASDPRDFNTHLSLARLLFAKADHKGAEKSYLEAIALNSKSSTPFVELSRLYTTRGELEKAEATLKRMIETEGENYRSLQILALFYESTGQWEKAEKTQLLCADSSQKDDINPLMSLGGFYARRNSYEKALAAMNKALDIKKGDLEILSSIAQLQFDFKHFEEAAANADKVLEKDKGHLGANFLKGRLYLANREYSLALEKFELLTRERPRSEMAFYYKALALIQKGEAKLAEPDLLKAIELNPKLLEPRLILAESYLRERNKELARQQIEAAQKISPADVRVISLMGNLKMLAQDGRGAEEVFKKLVELHPNDPSSYVRLGAFYGAAGRIPEAEKHLGKALELNPDQRDAIALITGIYVQQKKYEEALKLCASHRRRMGADPQSLAYVSYLEGRVLLSMGERGKALEHFEKAIESDPNTIGAYEAVARVHLAEKRLDQAREQYESIIQRDPNYVPGHMALGAIYEQLGELKKAEEAYRTALSIQKDFAPAANNLAWILVETGGNIDEALGLAQTAKSKMAKNPAVMDTLGWIYYLKGSLLNAIGELQDAVQLDASNAVIHHHLGQAFYKNNQLEKATESLERALSVDQNFKGAEQARKLLKEIKAKS